LEPALEKAELERKFPRLAINIILFAGALLWFLSPLFIVFAYARCSKTGLGLLLAAGYLIIGLISFYVLDFWPTIAAAYVAIWTHINILGSRDPMAVAPSPSESKKGLVLSFALAGAALAIFVVLAAKYYYSAPPL